MRACGWCGTIDDAGASACAKCGGPLPPPPGQDPGPPPGPSPRALPSRFTRRVFLNFGTLFGAVFTLVGVVFVTVFLVASCALPPMIVGACAGLAFPGVGVPVLYFGWRKAADASSALRRGTAVVGKVVGVGRAQGQGWLLEYTYGVGGRTLGGSVRTVDPVVAEYEVGEPIHVVYLPERPEVSAVWPPLVFSD